MGQTGLRVAGMILSMTKKLAISLPDDVAEDVRAAVEHGEAPSVSAYIAEALRAYKAPQDYDEFLAEWERESGPVSPEVEAWVDEQFERFGLRKGSETE